MKNFSLPKDYRPYIDKYFLRAKTILEKENLNPIAKYQVFIRKGGCKVFGLDEAIAILTKYTKNVKIYALKEGEHFEPSETLMTIEAPIQEIIDLETMYLGVLSAETTLKNGGEDISLTKIHLNTQEIVWLIKPRPMSYFGARHWRYDRDEEIAHACLAGGATNCSTDIGAKNYPKFNKGIGTIPHALEAIYHWKYGLKNAVYKSTEAFNKHIEKGIPRIALVDYANLEITDSLRVAPIVDGIRIDTCGENVMEGSNIGKVKKNWIYFNRGVVVWGVYLVRKLLNDRGFEKVRLILSSGFGNPEKVKTFLKAEKIVGIKLFDALGVGGLFDSRMATADIIEIDGKIIHKVGRMPKVNERLRRVV